MDSQAEIKLRQHVADIMVENKKLQAFILGLKTTTNTKLLRQFLNNHREPKFLKLKRKHLKAMSHEDLASLCQQLRTAFQRREGLVTKYLAEIRIVNKQNQLLRAKLKTFEATQDKKTYNRYNLKVGRKDGKKL